MNAQERTLIAGLFERLRGSGAAYRDPEADAFIADEVARQPHAPYAMAQTVIVQNQALEAAQAKIAELEKALEVAQQAAQSGAGSRADAWEERPAPSPWGPRAQEAMGAPGGFGGGFGSGFGGRQGSGAAAPWGGQPSAMQPSPLQQGRGGGFMSGALQTAAGVAGGALLFSGIQSMFGGGAEAAKAAETPAAAEPEKPEPQQTADAQPDAGESAAPEGGWFSGLAGDAGGDDGGSEGG